MHFGFYIPDHAHCRVLPLSYENYLNGAGFSGTEAALLEISRGLELQGHRTTVIQDLTRAPHANTFDFFTPLFFLSPEVKEWVRNLRQDCIVAVWLHCYVHHDVLCEMKVLLGKRPFSLIAVSETVARHVKDLLDIPVHVVPNGINREVWCAASGVRSKQHVFIATFERGGAIAAIVARKLGKKLATASYYHGGDLIANKSLSKKELRRLLEASDIFVYPLVLPSGVVHHDTYACCVHEAMAAGVVVVTWDVACFRDIYPSDAIVLVPPLEYPGYNPFATHGKNPALLSPEAVARLCDAVVALDRNPVRKEGIRERARTWAHAHTWDDSVVAFGNLFAG